MDEQLSAPIIDTVYAFINPQACPLATLEPDLSLYHMKHSVNCSSADARAPRQQLEESHLSLDRR